MYVRPISLLVGSTNMYEIFSSNLTPTMTHYPPPPPLLNCGIMVMLYLGAGLPHHLYQGMQKYFVIGLMKLYRSNSSDKIITNSICILFRRIVYMVSIKEDIIPNIPFQYSGTLLVILSVSRNMDFGDTR